MALLRTSCKVSMRRWLTVMASLVLMVSLVLLVEVNMRHPTIRLENFPLERLEHHKTRAPVIIERNCRSNHSEFWCSLYLDELDQPEIFNTWTRQTSRFCNGLFVGFNQEFALLKFVKIDMDLCNYTRTGGETIESVLNQNEEVEYLTYNVGFFQQECSGQHFSDYFKWSHHLNDWLRSLDVHHEGADQFSMMEEQFVIAIVRYEYVNLYHTMTDWYNAFIVMQFFKKSQAETNIILVDSHPYGSLDSVWQTLFNSTRRITRLPKQMTYSNMVWGIPGYNSLMMQHDLPSIPLVEEFRLFFLNSFNFSVTHQLDCRRLKILFIWRRDYVAHPRNSAGTISRKIKNEQELLKSVQNRYLNFIVRGVQIDLFDMQKQLDLVAKSDILIGMHGAGLTHTLFLPGHAGLIELYPHYWDTHMHFQAMARWRNLKYASWSNNDPANEILDYYTKVPVGVLHSLLRNVTARMCPKHSLFSWAHPWNRPRPYTTTTSLIVPTNVSQMPLPRTSTLQKTASGHYL